VVATLRRRRVKKAFETKTARQKPGGFFVTMTFGSCVDVHRRALFERWADAHHALGMLNAPHAH
jgi:hypothetical protein